MDKLLNAAAIETVNADPVESERPATNNFLNAWNDIFGLFFLFDIGIGAKLQINAIDIVRLFMQQCRLSRMKIGRKPEPAFRRKVSLHHNVGNQEPFLEITAFKFQPKLTTHLAIGTITGEQILPIQLIGTVGCLNPHRHMAIMLGDIYNLVLEAQINQIREISAAFDEILLNIILL